MDGLNPMVNFFYDTIRRTGGSITKRLATKQGQTRLDDVILWTMMNILFKILFSIENNAKFLTNYNPIIIKWMNLAT